MHVAIFTDTFTPDPNGVAIATSRHYDTLLRAGFKTDLFGPSTLQVPNPIPASKLFTSSDPNYSLYLPRRLPRITKDHDGVLVVHSHTPFSFGFLGLLVAKNSNAFAIYTHHTNFFDDYLHYIGRLNNRICVAVLRKMYQSFLSRFDAVIVPSEAARGDLLDTIYMESRKIFTLPTPPFSYAPHCQEQNSARDIDVIYVSRLAPEKNVDVAIDGMLCLQSQVPAL